MSNVVNETIWRYGYAISPQQRYYNYRLSRARMVIEGCYGQLKGRWRILSKKCESNKDVMKTVTLACMVLHNVCIEKGETLYKKLDMTLDPISSQRRDRATVRELLDMSSCRKINDTCQQANVIRDTLAQKLFLEKTTGTVC